MRLVTRIERVQLERVRKRLLEMKRPSTFVGAASLNLVPPKGAGQAGLLLGGK